MCHAEILCHSGGSFTVQETNSHRFNSGLSLKLIPPLSQDDTPSLRDTNHADFTWINYTSSYFGFKCHTKNMITWRFTAVLSIKAWLRFHCYHTRASSWEFLIRFLRSDAKQKRVDNESYNHDSEMWLLIMKSFIIMIMFDWVTWLVVWDNERRVDSTHTHLSWCFCRLFFLKKSLFFWSLFLI